MFNTQQFLFKMNFFSLQFESVIDQIKLDDIEKVKV